jgi:hypothetical protein
MTNQAPAPALGGSWLSVGNLPVEGSPSPEWSGAIGVTEHQAAGSVNPQRGGPPAGGYNGTSSPFAAEYTPDPAEPGIIADTTYLEGHEAPWPVAGSAQAEPFAPSGAVGNELHGRDQGAYGASQPRGGTPSAPGYFYAQVPGQSYDSQAQVTDNAGWKISTPAPMRSSWQRTGQVLPDNVPLWLPSIEHPYQVQLAQGPTAIVPGTPLAPDGTVPDMGQMYDGTTIASTPPTPPAVPTTQPVSQAYEPGAGWL